MIYIGIDPGKTGAVCIIRDADDIDIHKMPETPSDLAELIRAEAVRPIICAVEKQQAGGFAGQKVGAKSMFTFGMGYGIIQGVLAGLSVPFILVPPKTWQKELGALPADKAARKTAVLMRMQSEFPAPKIHKYAADAVAIARYIRRTHP